MCEDMHSPGEVDLNLILRPGGIKWIFNLMKRTRASYVVPDKWARVLCSSQHSGGLVLRLPSWTSRLKAHTKFKDFKLQTCNVLQRPRC